MSFPIEAFKAKCSEEQRSPEFITQAVAYIEDIEGKGFPALFSLVHFGIELGLPSDQLYELLKPHSLNYNYFQIKKKLSDSKREIMAPKDKIKFVQRWINYNILQKAHYSSNVTGFLPKTSTLKNAKAHEGAKFVLKVDLLKFFDCIDQKRIYGIFRSFGYVKNLAYDLASLCTSRHRKSYWDGIPDEERKLMLKNIDSKSKVLPQGAPTSPLLANLVARRLDMRINKLSVKMGFCYTRYADDLCLSCNDINNLPDINFLKKIIEDEGFFINSKKVHLCIAGKKQYVTGLSITNVVSVSKNKRREIFKHLHFLRKFGPEVHLKHLHSKGEYRTNFRDWLQGHISYNYGINPKVGQKMFDLFNLINWEMDYKVSAFESTTRTTRNID